MTPERFKRITSVLEKRQPDLTVITDEVHKGRNLSAIVRSCDAVGVDTLYSVVPREGFQTYSGTSASAEKWVEVEYCNDVISPIKKLKNQGYQVVAAHLTANAIEYTDADYTRPTALVLGAEVVGVSAQAQALVDCNVMIPMFGMVESFNVSVACAVILMEARKQRQNAGLYDSVRLEESLYKKRFFNWAHPKLAAFCDKKCIDYPDVDDTGEVIDLPGWYEHVRKKLSE